MATDKENGFAMVVSGVANGTTSFQSKKTGKFYYSVILLIPGSENNLKIDLTNSSPDKFQPGTAVQMKIMPKYWNNRFAGLMEV